jgi:hypothetical protein
VHNDIERDPPLTGRWVLSLIMGRALNDSVETIDRMHIPSDALTHLQPLPKFERPSIPQDSREQPWQVSPTAG